MFLYKDRVLHHTFVSYIQFVYTGFKYIYMWLSIEIHIHILSYQLYTTQYIDLPQGAWHFNRLPHTKKKKKKIDWKKLEPNDLCIAFQLVVTLHDMVGQHFLTQNPWTALQCNLLSIIRQFKYLTGFKLYNQYVFKKTLTSTFF